MRRVIENTGEKGKIKHNEMNIVLSSVTSKCLQLKFYCLHEWLPK